MNLCEQRRTRGSAQTAGRSFSVALCGCVLCILIFAVCCQLLYFSFCVTAAGPASTMASRSTLVNHELSKLFNELWDADVNRLTPGKDYQISLQGKAGYVPAGSNQARDSASYPLFQYVDEEQLKNRKTLAAFVSLLDNYEMSTGVAEVVTSEEVAENNRFLDAILETKVMQLAHQYLVKKNLSKPNLKDFKSQMYSIWFQLYTREGGKGPCYVATADDVTRRGDASNVESVVHCLVVDITQRGDQTLVALSTCLWGNLSEAKRSWDFITGSSFTCRRRETTLITRDL
ncbi:poly(U)-specific endoribonuclease isoform X2 [Bombina bombina]|uniref:poly(U)-specific endoribonuclease isoform X2 n=1 Tax=Bombina bombina TaxID=8345 RepID=UPI00235AE041|nr:poly(U)-specific endoribonuclease isoform X2 [Bombina bombina]